MSKQTFVLWPEADWAEMMQRVQQHVLSLPRRRAVDIHIEPHRVERTPAANRYLFGVCYRKHLMPHLGHTVEDWHEFFCGDHFGWDNMRMIGRRGKQTPIRTTTTDENGERDVLPPEEFWQFVEHVRMRAAENGIEIPDPTPEDIAAYEQFWVSEQNAKV